MRQRTNQNTNNLQPQSTGLWQEQIAVLVPAINGYLYWRKFGIDNRRLDNRGFDDGLFTWVRHHFTDFGLNRANALLAQLQRSPNPNPYPILMNHFTHDSYLHNHSLDTWLLEAILQHAHLFQIDFRRLPFVILQTKSERAQLQNHLCLNYQLTTELEATYAVSKLMMTTDPEKAMHYLHISSQHNHYNAFNELKKLAKTNVKARYLVGCLFHTKNEFANAADYLFKADEDGSVEAAHFLKEMIFPETIYLSLARQCEAAKKLDTAFLFYSKASQLEQAALRLGAFYEKGEPFLKADKIQAFRHYQQAAKKKSVIALNNMNKLAPYLQDPQLIEIADLYLTVFSQPLTALEQYKQLADKPFLPGQIRLDELTKKYADYAVYVAELYKKESSLDKACFYYKTALFEHNNQKALNRLKELADENHHANAMYTLGMYKFRQKPSKEAIDYCIRAVKGNCGEAETWLYAGTFSSDLYLYIAREFKKIKYEKNSIFFYEKATEAGNVKATWYIGYLWHTGKFPGKPADLKKAFYYYQNAAQKNHKKSLDGMLLIAKKMQENQLWIDFGQMYCNGQPAAIDVLIALKKMAESQITAEILLYKIALNNPENAFVIASLYEADNIRENRIKKTGLYYVLSKENAKSDIQNTLKVQEKMANLLDESTTAEEWILLGELYYKPSVIKPDFLKSVYYFQKAAELGSSEAFYRLGMLYLSDAHLDRMQAVAWFIKGKNHPLAHQELHNILSGKNTSLQFLQQLKYVFQVGSPLIEKNTDYEILCQINLSNRGNTGASFRLGQFFQVSNEKTPKNDSEAFANYARAARAGNVDALNPMERLAEDLGADSQTILSEIYKTVFKNPEKASFWAEKAAEANGSFFNF